MPSLDVLEDGVRIRFNAMFAAAFLALFIPFPVYPVVFLLFSFLVVMRDRLCLDLSDNRDRLLLPILAFISIGVMVSWVNGKPVWCDSGIKLVVNMLFLASVLRWDHFIRNRRAAINALALAIVVSVYLTGLQVFVNVALTGAWLDPFIGISDSVVAYKIVGPGIYWGINEKNIWATKVAFQSILILYMLSRKLIKIHWIQRWGLWVSIIFSIVYTFSRTSQGVFFFFLAWEYYLRKIDFRTFVKKPVHVMGFGCALALLGWKAYDKLFHLTLQPGDGMESRFRMWTYLWNAHSVGDFWFGKGYQYGRDFLPAYRMVESNFHNVFINLLVDFGFSGILVYATLLVGLAKIIDRSLLSYLIMTFMVQYSGYDNDAVVFVAAAIVICGGIEKVSSVKNKQGALV